MTFENSFVNYEDFGAIGDGVADDLPAIHAAHEHANANNLSVKTKSDATYHLGKKAIIVTITTDTDWNTSRFTIDDVQVEDYQTPIFKVCSLLEPEDLHLGQILRDQARMDVRPEHDCHVLVENDQKRTHIRRGVCQNEGAAQHDCFVLRRDGSVEGSIDWDYDSITRIEARPIDERSLLLCGGIFTTIANQMKQGTSYNGWSRNIEITRSNTVVDGLTHYVVGETDVGNPYKGFLLVSQCANITLRNCFATGHKIYSFIGTTRKQVKMGSYDYKANDVVNFRMVNCRMNHITDCTRWGVIATNFCKNILLEDCFLSRMDTHMGVSGTYTIRGCTLGHQGLNAIGRGILTVEDSTLHGTKLINFRRDYGSTWEGDVVIRNCRWIPTCGETTQPHMFGGGNDGRHDFGYPCSMPREITIDGLFVDDTNYPDDYGGMYFFTDPDRGRSQTGIEPTLFPYEKCQRVKVRGLRMASGKKPRISPHAEILKDTVLIEEE